MLNIRLNLKSPTLHKTSWQYPLKIYLDADDEFDTKVENMRMQDHASFVKANPWPEEKLIMDYIKNHFMIKLSLVYITKIDNKCRSNRKMSSRCNANILV